jgi:hypothetical protein
VGIHPKELKAHLKKAFLHLFFIHRGQRWK